MPYPPGFKIDSVTGVVTWTPQVRGWYPIGIMARSNRGEMGFQRFTVTITGGNGIVQGKVSDTTGAGIAGVVIEVVQANALEPSNLGCFRFAAKTDPNGNYRIANIEPGLYKLHAVSPSPQFASQWYDGKATPDEANRVNVPDSPAVTIANFTLRAGTARLPLVKVMGEVTDTLGQPVKGAQVYFARQGFALNSNSEVEDFRQMFDQDGQNGQYGQNGPYGPSLDFRLDGNSAHVFRAVVDSLGRYKIAVPPGAYIAYARAPGYAVQFYLTANSMLNARYLKLFRDTTGIDFVLTKLPPIPLGTIKGSVIDTAKEIGVRSRIVALRDRWLATDPYRIIRAYWVDTDSLGNYVLDNLLPGAYIVFALPMGNYAPAFYCSDSLSTHWRRATRIPINGNIVTGIDIYVREIPVSTRGYAAITGRVILNAGTGSDVAGTLVVAARNGVVAGYGFADATGSYSINGLAPGTYAVTADLPGTSLSQTKTASLSYNATGAPVGAVVDLNLSLVTDVQERPADQPVSFGLAQNYPNPFNPTTTIGFQLATAGQVELKVYNLLGQEVVTLVNAYRAPGAYTATLDAASLPSGVYLYRLTVGSSTATRKMVLMK
jgi:protocatechuate 3,4-dioxygenase beta subunit